MERDVCQVLGKARPSAQSAGPASLATFDETERTLTPAEAVAEALRCTAASPCTYCQVCELICPDLAITRDPNTRIIHIDLAYCKGCGLCAHYCPHQAISMAVDD